MEENYNNIISISNISSITKDSNNRYWNLYRDLISNRDTVYRRYAEDPAFNILGFEFRSDLRKLLWKYHDLLMADYDNEFSFLL